MVKQSALTISELQEIEVEKEKQSVTLNKGDKFTLQCGHEGRVVWISSDRKTFCVKGVRRRCHICGKGPSDAWAPTVYVFSPKQN